MYTINCFITLYASRVVYLLNYRAEKLGGGGGGRGVRGKYRVSLSVPLEHARYIRI